MMHHDAGCLGNPGMSRVSKLWENPMAPRFSRRLIGPSARWTFIDDRGSPGGLIESSQIMLERSEPGFIVSIWLLGCKERGAWRLVRSSWSELRGESHV